jgi:hypothetical protein
MAVRLSCVTWYQPLAWSSTSTVAPYGIDSRIASLVLGPVHLAGSPTIA